jgi:hypothetical protein
MSQTFSLKVAGVFGTEDEHRSFTAAHTCHIRSNVVGDGPAKLHPEAPFCSQYMIRMPAEVKTRSFLLPSPATTVCRTVCSSSLNWFKSATDYKKLLIAVMNTWGAIFWPTTRRTKQTAHHACFHISVCRSPASTRHSDVHALLTTVINNH